MQSIILVLIFVITYVRISYAYNEHRRESKHVQGFNTIQHIFLFIAVYIVYWLYKAICVLLIPYAVYAYHKIYDKKYFFRCMPKHFGYYFNNPYLGDKLGTILDYYENKLIPVLQSQK